VITADTFGVPAEAIAGCLLTFETIARICQGGSKRDFINRLGRDGVAIGNGRQMTGKC